MTALAGGQLRVEHKFIVREDPDTRGGGSRKGKIEWDTRSRLFRGSRRTGTALRLHRQGSSGGFFFSAIRGEAGPGVAARVEKAEDQEKHYKNRCNRKPLRRCPNALPQLGKSDRHMFLPGHLLLAQEHLFLHTQVRR